MTFWDAISLHFSPFWQKQPIDFSDLFHKEDYMAFLYANIDNFNSGGF